MKDTPYIDPQMVPVLAAIKERVATRTPMTALSPEEMRKRVRNDFISWNEEAPDISRIENFDIPGPYGSTKIRLYDTVPKTKELRPMLIYYHGGGWVIGDLDMEDRSLRQLAIASDCAILSIDYILAPEYKFPAPVEDCCSAVRWLVKHGKELGLDVSRLAIGGGSAGANLALATALSLRDSNELTARFLLFFYGVFSSSMDSESYGLFGNGDFGLSKEGMNFFQGLYLDNADNKHHPLVSPIEADLTGLPPAFFSVAGLDPLRDDSRQLVEKLRMNNISADMREYEGVIHGFMLMGRSIDVANLAIEEARAALKAGLG